MKIAIVTDSTAYLPERIKDHPNLFVIPIPVILDGKIYNEGIDIEADEYYALLNNSKEFPTTSQPALGEVLELYKSIANKGTTPSSAFIFLQESLVLFIHCTDLLMKSQALLCIHMTQKLQVCQWDTW